MTASLPQHACPAGWEQDPRIDDGHAHDWRTVLTQPWGPNHPEHVETMIVCAECGAPRCGHSDDPAPCIERRHHRCFHRLADGDAWPIGGAKPGQEPVTYPAPQPWMPNVVEVDNPFRREFRYRRGTEPWT